MGLLDITETKEHERFFSLGQPTMSLVLGAMAVLLHGLAVFLVVFPARDPSILYLSEFVFVVAVATILGIVLTFAVSLAVFRILVVTRLALVVIALNIVGTGVLIVWVFLTVPLIVEIVAYDKGRGRRILLGLMVGGTFLSALFRVLDTPLLPAFGFVVAYGVAVVLLLLSLSMTIRYRERLVERSQRVESLEATVMRLSEANQAFQSYADNLENESMERERYRIAGELHDTIGYALTNVIVMMKAGRILLEDDPNALAGVFDRVSEQSKRALEEVRQTLHRMKSIRASEPKGMDHLYELTKVFEGATGVSVKVHRGNLPQSLGPRLDEFIHRLVQEGLTNAFRHGSATTVEVFAWRDASEIRISIRDNGLATSAASVSGEGIGLSGIRERLAEFGGALFMRNLPVGFELEVQIPYKRRIGYVENQDAHRR